jgi:hypothetical protein
MSGGGGDYLDNDTLISNQLVFDIVDVVDDRNGGFNGNDRWIVKVEPHYDGESDPTGLITLNDNPARRKFMTVIQSELDALEKSGGEVFIGPCVLVKLKGRNYRYIEIVEWDLEANRPILPDGAVLAGAVTDAGETRSRRTRGGSDVAEPNGVATANDTPARSRSFVPADGGNAAPRSAVVVPAAAPIATPAPITSPVPVATPAPITTSGGSSAPSTDFPTVKEWARSQGIEVADRGRVRREVSEAYERAKSAALGTGDYAAPEPATPAPARSRTRTTAETAPEPHTRPAQVGAGAPSKRGVAPQGGAQSAREVVWSPGVTGNTTCSVCNEIVHDRVFPKSDGSGYNIVHKCSTGEMFTLDAVLDPEAS